MLHNAYPLLRLVTAGLCAWECATILLDHPKYPTLSRLASRHWWISPLLLVSLAFHLLMLEKFSPITNKGKDGEIGK